MYMAINNGYATLDQIKLRLANKVTEGQEAELEELVEAASRAIDSYLEVAEGYFVPAGDTPTTRILKGTGDTFINLPAPLSGTVTITADEDLTVPNFMVDGTRLRTLRDNDLPSSYIVWQSGYYSILGIWGFTATPAQIREACLQLTVHFWRGRDKALTGTITDMRTDEQFPERDYPRMTRRLLDDYKYGLGEKASGGLILA